MVEKSKKAIKDALLEIMYEKDFNDITVSELLKKANISRGTFYAHFKNLEDVKQALIYDLYVHADYIFGDYSASALSRDPSPVMLMAAEMMYASRDPSKRLFKFVTVYDLGIMLKDWLAKFILDDEKLVENLGGYDLARVYAHFISGGITHAYNMWIQDDCPVPPDVFAASCQSILLGGINAVSADKD
ncbi:MAG: TetR/AcrR family transcriptional regulator [Bacillota bacterium]|nr:TetR/AcrR family transcriptional regulator [Bacillota bacterium]